MLVANLSEMGGLAGGMVGIYVQDKPSLSLSFLRRLASS
jgi:hypothetical protein